MRGVRVLRKGLPPVRYQGYAGDCGGGRPQAMCGMRQMPAGMPCGGDRDDGGGGMKRRWNDFMWIVSLFYLVLGFFNILFAW